MQEIEIKHSNHRLVSSIVPLVCIGIFAVVGFAYSLVVPPFETPDELFHYAFARHLALGGNLPVQTVEADGPWQHEGTQAPLYYLMLGRLIAPIDHSDFEAVSKVNARANLGDPLYPGNKNFMLYSTQALPLRGTNLAVHVGRWLSLSFSCLTLWFIYKIGRLAFPTAPHLAIITLLIPATLPQFAFISASVSNDALVILLATATLYKLATLSTRPHNHMFGWRDWVLVGLLVALASLSKLHALGLVPMAALVLIGLAWQRRQWRIMVKAAMIIAIVFVLVAGWWYWRNFSLYGDFLAVGTLLEIEGLRKTTPSWSDFWGELRGLRYSFWGLFGWFSILLPTWVYHLLDMITVLALVGWLLAIPRNWHIVKAGFRHAAPHQWVRLYLVIWGVLLLTLKLYWLTFAISSQGRLLFPALSAYSVMLVLGLQAVFQPGGQALAHLLIFSRKGRAEPRSRGQSPPSLCLAALPAGLFAISVYALCWLLPQSYQAAPPLAEIPSTAQKVGRIYGDSVEVVAFSVPSGTYAAGATVPVTLYLRKLLPVACDYQLFVQLLDSDINEIANVTTHPGWGKNPTTLWEVDQIYADSYELVLAQSLSSNEPIHARLYVGFMDCDGELLDVPGYEWDIASRTVGYVWVN